jgi:hypothetical protein
MNEVFVFDFVYKGSLTPIDIVEDITGLTVDEIKKVSEILIIKDERK